ncbi:tRNA (adenosine(37)-N6)-threonylcarbamoyltransferase complex dimerization subunit type 1 TsaB [Chryseolinea lacunae]|uniref:tRNA (Adenosine(37)-N6)-threonylcarbamoyltransferase complex dimerization subunit type 1 TsaB n=1 Tax=Chryseolinea lacunae TaxID=2801331 RepID=A0ABS1KRJ1_9BACT|nr:tRNA (adenosine(37)-N6)-threonylcarbamoyltransferase complex dimerization subunit type 1 TsaB [Chryseolinea lacunae]MBL0742095.1 tRNA (adenosine(37)-N6)-threonylcarbamoyltransferase complex dimerization subunit type 1 TsaB [Chryseolinea lacunae]
MPLLLSLETSTTVCSVALHENNTLLSMAEVHREHSHASKLAPLIDQVVRTADVTLKDISAVAVASGPGSYTGLRIGTSTAKGLCYALSIPLVAVGTLEIMAAQVNATNVSKARLCPMIDARRMEVYCQIFDAGNTALQAVEAKVIDEHSFEKELEEGPIIFFGNGADKCRPVITHPNAIFISGITPSAANLGALAWTKFQQQRIEDLVHFEPFYLKEFMIKKPASLNQP